MASEAFNEVYSRMIKVKSINSLDWALDFLNQFVVAGVEYPEAHYAVTQHFKKVDPNELADSYDKA